MSAFQYSLIPSTLMRPLHIIELLMLMMSYLDIIPRHVFLEHGATDTSFTGICNGASIVTCIQ